MSQERTLKYRVRAEGYTSGPVTVEANGMRHTTVAFDGTHVVTAMGRNRRDLAEQFAASVRDYRAFMKSLRETPNPPATVARRGSLEINPL